jgi:homoserine dehydrogenase
MPSNDLGNILIVQLGVGLVGGTVIDEVPRLAPIWRHRHGIALAHWAVADSSGFVIPHDGERWLAPDTLADLSRARRMGRRLTSFPAFLPSNQWRQVLEDAILSAGNADRVIVVDCTVGHGTTELLLAARATGAHVVLCNKDPLAGPMSQFHALRQFGTRGSLRISATVGAGLPITSAVMATAANGDTILGLRAVASGSLGELCGAMCHGGTFPRALHSAIAAGYCEPDPRHDLTGYDVARKLLILARLAGFNAEMADIAVESLIPPSAESLTRDEFLAALPTWDSHLRERFVRARESGFVLRYVGTIDADGSLWAGLCEIAQDDPLASGKGPENAFMLRTARYDHYPLVIRGPGAGASVTAGAVVSDILRAAGIL